MIMKVFLMEYYLDYVNNYLTVEKFAEDNGITKTEAKTIIRIGKKYNNQLNILLKRAGV